MTNPSDALDTKAVVDALVARLRELQATGESEVINRRIVAGRGLVGGGTLTDDVTLGLSQATQDAVSRAERSVSTDELAEALADYVTAADYAGALGDYLRRADAYRALSLPFSHPGVVSGTVDAPPVLPTGPGIIERVSVAVAEPGPDVSVTVAGRRFVLAGGRASGVFEHGGPATTSTPISLSISSAGARGVTVLLRIREEV